MSCHCGIEIDTILPPKTLLIDMVEVYVTVADHLYVKYYTESLEIFYINLSVFN